MRVLITGADGHLARAVMAALQGQDSVVALDTRFTEPLRPGVEGLEADLRDPASVSAALSGAEAVLHLAPLRSSTDDELATLDEASRGTYVLATAALDAGIRRFVLGSSLDLFDRVPARWDVTELWRPRPEPRIEHLRAWLAELSGREVTRASDARVICLRFGHPVDGAVSASLPYDPRWLHVEDAVAGVRRALVFETPGWSVFHITSAGRHAKVRLAEVGRESFGYRPAHDFSDSRPAGAARDQALDSPERSMEEVLAPRSHIRSRPIRNVVIFGAGGPLAAAAASELSTDYTLRLTDVRSITEIAAAGAHPGQNPGAPVPLSLGPPHECRVVDVTSPDEVMAACEGMDAILNCTVIRHDPAGAFRINTLGAYNVVRAAVAHGIRRVVHTGPQLVTLHGEVDYSADYDIPADAPPRPGRHLYGHSKYLGQEICRVFADYYDLEIPVLLFSEFIQPETGQPRPLYPFAVSWRDAATAIRRALEIPALPSPYEVLHVHADLPHGKYASRKAKEVLDWRPVDDLRHMWSDID
jgi:uronate dehydrogenase